MRKSDSYRKMKALTASLAAGFLAFAPLVADAGLTVSRSISTSGRSKHLENGTIYTITSDLEFKSLSELSAFYMDANSTSVLYIATGSTLNLTGGSGSGMTGACKSRRIKRLQGLRCRDEEGSGGSRHGC